MFSRKSKADKEQERIEREQVEIERKKQKAIEEAIENRRKIIEKHSKRLAPEIGDTNIITFSYSKNENVVVALYPDRIRLRSFQRSIINTGLRGEKTIYLNRITSVQFKEPGLSAGYIQFKLGSEGESRSSTLDAVSDENAVTFGHDQLIEFQRLRGLIEEQIQEANSSFGQPQTPGSTADELAKLADLRDRGILTAEEFEAQKVKLLLG